MALRCSPLRATETRVKVVGGELYAMRAVKLFKDLGRKRHVGWPLGAHMVIDAEDLVEALGHVGEVVGRQQYYAALISKGLEHLDNPLLRPNVHPAESLVQQYYAGLLGQGPCYKDPSDAALRTAP